MLWYQLEDHLGHPYTVTFTPMCLEWSGIST